MKRLTSITLATLALLTGSVAAQSAPLPAADLPADPPVAIPVDDFRHVGDYVVTSRLKITDAEITRVPIKPVRLAVFTNGTEIRVAISNSDEESVTTFRIYRSDGIGRQNSRGGALEIVPGLQASCERDGILAHLRLTTSTLTITRFPGVSNQTIVTHAVAAPKTAPPAQTATRATTEPSATTSP